MGETTFVGGSVHPSPEEECLIMSPNVSPGNSVPLSPRQTAALPYIASESSLVEGARAAQIARCTLTRWMREPAFRAELERVRRNISDLAFSELEGFTLKSVIRLVQLLDDPDSTVRHRAAKTVISISIAVRQDKEIRRQLDTIDNALIMLKAQR